MLILERADEVCLRDVQRGGGIGEWCRGVRSDVIGEPYADADGTAYHALFRQPVMIFEGSKENLTAAHQRALARGFQVAVFTSDMFVTGHDEANRAVVRAVGRDDLDLVGFALHGPKNAFDKVVKGAHWHP